MSFHSVEGTRGRQRSVSRSSGQHVRLDDDAYWCCVCSLLSISTLERRGIGWRALFCLRVMYRRMVNPEMTIL